MKRTIIYVLAVIGLAITGYLSYSSFFDSSVCTAEGCSTVLASAYSHILGIPVAFLGFLVYALIIYYHSIRDDHVLPWLLLLGVLAVWYFNWSMIKLSAFCLWCEASHIIMILLYFVYNGLSLKSIGYFVLALCIGIAASETFTLFLG